MYKKILNPETGRYVNIKSSTGKKVLEKYKREIQKAGMWPFSRKKSPEEGDGKKKKNQK